MLPNVSPLIITPQFFHHLNLNLNTTLLANQLLTLLQHKSLMLNMNKLTSMTLLSTNITIRLTNVAIFSIYFQNINYYLMASLEFILIRRSTLSNLEPSRCTTMLILSLMYIVKHLKKNLTTWLNLVSLNLAAPLNGRLQPSLSPKRMVASNKLLTYDLLIKQSYKNNTP